MEENTDAEYEVPTRLRDNLAKSKHGQFLMVSSQGNSRLYMVVLSGKNGGKYKRCN